VSSFINIKIILTCHRRLALNHSEKLMFNDKVWRSTSWSQNALTPVVELAFNVMLVSFNVALHDNYSIL